MDPNPTTSSETSFTMRVSSRWGRMVPAGTQDAAEGKANDTGEPPGE